MTKTKLNIRWIETGIIVVMALPVIVTLVLLIAWTLQMSEQEIQNMNTEARCKTVGGEMGYSKCYKNGKEI
jgi:hypothetical protein